MTLAALRHSRAHQQTFIRMAAHWNGVAQECGGKFRSWFAWCQPETGEANPRPWSPFVAQFIGSYLKIDSDPEEVSKAYMPDNAGK